MPYETNTSLNIGTNIKRLPDWEHDMIPKLFWKLINGIAISNFLTVRVQSLRIGSIKITFLITIESNYQKSSENLRNTIRLYTFDVIETLKLIN